MKSLCFVAVKPSLVIWWSNVVSLSAACCIIYARFSRLICRIQSKFPYLFKICGCSSVHLEPPSYELLHHLNIHLSFSFCHLSKVSLSDLIEALINITLYLFPIIIFPVFAVEMKNGGGSSASTEAMLHDSQSIFTTVKV